VAPHGPPDAGIYAWAMSDEIETVEPDPASAETELAPERVRELAGAGDARLIDVRRDYEFAEGHLPGARQVEINHLTAQADSIPKDRVVVFYCRSGNRSGMAAAAFREGGWDAHNLAGGIVAWVEAGHPLDPADGHVAEPRPPTA
jgi:rhodanese-related sulfurtransferase